MRFILPFAVAAVAACASAPQHHTSSSFLSETEVAQLATADTASLMAIAHRVDTRRMDTTLSSNSHVWLPTIDHDQHQYDLGQPAQAIRVQTNGDGGFVEGDNRLVHQPSGLSCPGALSAPYSGETRKTLSLTEVTLHQRDGSDVSCNYASEDGRAIFTLYASRWPDIGLNEHANAAANDMIQAFPNPSAADIPVLAVEPEGPSLIAGTAGGGFSFAYPDGRTGQTALFISVVGDWHIKVRTTVLPGSEEYMLWSTVMHQAEVVLVNNRQLELQQAASS